MASSPSYVDGMNVKISEKYKPPYRISLPVTYSQRLSLNNQLLDNTPDYNFAFEISVKEKICELKNARKLRQEDREKRLTEARREFDERMQKEEQEKKAAESKKLETNLTNQPYSVNGVLMPNVEAVKSVLASENGKDLLSSANSSKGGILMPTPAPTYSNILKPTPLNSYESSRNTVERKPFNISDFEADTSSPFDHMELKSINDMEELAQVLKSDSSYVPYCSPSTIPQISANYSNYNYNATTNIPYVTPSIPSYPLNGYYYPVGIENPVDQQLTPKTYCNSVPDIMKSLENDLYNSHIQVEPKDITNNISSPSKPKSTDAIYSRGKIKEKLVNPLDTLTRDEQALCRSVSLMGFPVDRVARACQVIGNDHKKIVEHLLALSDLLDLGFTEKDASDALLRNDNDRDRALDSLIS